MPDPTPPRPPVDGFYPETIRMFYPITYDAPSVPFWVVEGRLLMHTLDLQVALPLNIKASLSEAVVEAIRFHYGPDPDRPRFHNYTITLRNNKKTSNGYWGGYA